METEGVGIVPFESVASPYVSVRTVLKDEGQNSAPSHFYLIVLNPDSLILHVFHV